MVSTPVNRNRKYINQDNDKHMSHHNNANNNFKTRSHPLTPNTLDANQQMCIYKNGSVAIFHHRNRAVTFILLLYQALHISRLLWIRYP